MTTKKQSATAAAKGAPIAGAKAAGHSIDEFKAAFDKSYIVPNKIKAALAKLEGGWQFESEFVKLAGVSLADLAAYRSMFEDHIVSLTGEARGKRAWASTKAIAAKMREMLR